MSNPTIDDELVAARKKWNDLIAANKEADARVLELRGDLAVLRRSREARPSEIAVMESRLKATEVRAREADEAVANQRAAVESVESRLAYERMEQLIADLRRLAPAMVDVQDKLAAIANEADSAIRTSGESASLRELFGRADETEVAHRIKLMEAALHLARYKKSINQGGNKDESQ